MTQGDRPVARKCFICIVALILLEGASVAASTYSVIKKIPIRQTAQKVRIL